MVDSRRPAANDNDGPVFSLTRGQLEELIHGAVSAALALRNSLPVLVDKQDLARQLGCSAKQIDRLRKSGLPWLPVGECVRFEPSKVLDWLREHGAVAGGGGAA